MTILGTDPSYAWCSNTEDQSSITELPPHRDTIILKMARFRHHAFSPKIVLLSCDHVEDEPFIASKV